MNQSIKTTASASLTNGAHTLPLILLVEDDDIIQMVHQRFIEQCGYQVHSVNTGQAALNRLAQYDYAAIVLDLGLPDIKGEEVILAIRKREKDTHQYLPIMVNTAHGDAEIFAECRKKGADATFLKPIMLKQFRQVLMQLIQPKVSI